MAQDDNSIKYCEQCGSKFDAFPLSKRFCDSCADKRTKRRTKLQHEKEKSQRKIEKKLGTTLPTSPVEGWQDLIMEDLANPFNPMTEEELCLKYGVPATEFYASKSKHPDFMGELNKRAAKYIDQEGIFYRKMLVKQAKSNPTAVLVGLQLTKQYNKKQLEEDPLAGMSDQDKLTELKQLLSKAQNGGKL